MSNKPSHWIFLAISLANVAALDAARDAEKKLFHAGYDLRKLEIYSGVAREYVQEVGRMAWQKEFLDAASMFGVDISNFPKQFSLRRNVAAIVEQNDECHRQYDEGLISLEEYARYIAEQFIPR